jgi:hypothetical protein
MALLEVIYEFQEKPGCAVFCDCLKDEMMMMMMVMMR